MRHEIPTRVQLSINARGNSLVPMALPDSLFVEDMVFDVVVLLVVNRLSFCVPKGGRPIDSMCKHGTYVHSTCAYVYICVYVCVHVRERGKEVGKTHGRVNVCCL